MKAQCKYFSQHLLSLDPNIRAGTVDQIQRTELVENQMTKKMNAGPKIPKTGRPNNEYRFVSNIWSNLQC